MLGVVGMWLNKEAFNSMPLRENFGCLPYLKSLKYALQTSVLSGSSCKSRCAYLGMRMC